MDYALRIEFETQKEMEEAMKKLKHQKYNVSVIDTEEEFKEFIDLEELL